MKINRMCAVIKPKYNTKVLPEHLFYHQTKSTKQLPWDVFVMFSTTGKKDKGILVCRKTATQFRDDYKGKTLCIDNILAIPQYKGLGSKLLEFAENYSKKSGCNGYMILKADSSFTPNKIPHLFYRKKNFTTLNKKNDKKMDEFIKRGKDATYKDFPCMIMHYPAAKRKQTLWKTFLSKIFDLF